MATFRTVSLALFPLVFLASVTPAQAGDPDVQKIADQLKEVAARLDDLADFDKLGTRVPFTPINPSDVLELADLFKETLGKAMDTASTDSCEDLRTALLGVPSPFRGVAVTFDEITLDCSSSPFTFGFKVTAFKTVSPSLSVSDQTNGIGLSGGAMSVTVTLTSTLNFQLDTSAGPADERFALLTKEDPSTADDPKINVSVRATGDISGFAGIAGIVDVDVTGTAELNIDIGITLSDPDTTGLLTVNELKNTSFFDLTKIDYIDDIDGPSVDAVRIELKLDTTRITGSPDATITLTHADLEGFLGDLDASVDLIVDLKEHLGNFLSTHPTEILTGLSSLASSIAGIELLTNVQVPFMDVSLAETFEFAEPILDFLRSQTGSAIVCGTEDDNPPRGNVINLKNGDRFFCQAIALNEPFSFEWKPGPNVAFACPGGGVCGGGVCSGGDDDTLQCDNHKSEPGSVATAASATVEFVMKFTPDPADETQRPDIMLELTANQGDLPKTFSRTFISVEEMFKKLLEVGNFTSDMTVAGVPLPFYNETDKTLTFHLKKTFDPEAFGDGLDAEGNEEIVNLDFADRLREGTGLGSLSASVSANAGASVDAGPIVIEFTFGIILVDDVADITPAPADTSPVSELDRFFVQVRTGTGEYELQADATATIAPLELSGQVGFLRVSVVGNSAANLVDSSTAFAIGRKPIASTQPMIAVDILPTPGGIAVTGLAGNIQDAILVTQLINDLSGSISPQFNIAMSGGLLASADLATASGVVEATIGIDFADVVVGTWPDIKLGTPAFSGTFNTNLRIFDTDPGVFSHATATSTDQGVCSEDGSIICHHASADTDCGTGKTCDTPTDTLTDNVIAVDFRAGRCSGDSTVDCVVNGDCPQIGKCNNNESISCTVATEVADCGTGETCDSDGCVSSLLGRTLRNIDDGSSCIINDVVDADTVRCLLGGGDQNIWTAGDKYELVGNPLDLLSVILDNLSLIVKGIDDLTGGPLGDALSTELPLVGVSPEEIIAFVGDLESIIEKIRSGEPDAQINCTWNTVDDLEREPSNLTGLPGGKRCENSLSTRCDSDGDCPSGACKQPNRCSNGLGVFCTGNAECDDPAVAGPETCLTEFKVELMCNATIGALPDGDAVKDNVVWKLVHVSDGTMESATNAPGSGTVGVSPSATANFNLPDGGTLGTDFLITLEYETKKSGTRRGRIPAEANSLQSLEELLEDHLGIPDNALTFELKDLPPPGTTTPDGIQDLVIRLGFGECTRNNTIAGITCLPDVDRIVDQQKLLFGLGLIFPGISDTISENLEGFVGLDEDTSAISLQYLARARLDLAIPLDPTFNSDAVVVIDTTGITARVGADLQNASLSLTAGPAELRADAVAKMAAHFDINIKLAGTCSNDGNISCTVAQQEADCGVGNTCQLIEDGTDNNQTFSISDFIGMLHTTLDGGDGTGTPLGCGDIKVAKVISGVHDSTGPDNGVIDSDQTGTEAKGCQANGECPNAADKDIVLAQKGAELRKLDSDDNIIVKCDSADFIGGELMCLKVGAQPKHCSESTTTPCTDDTPCTNSENDKCVDFACTGNSDCQSSEVCDTEDGKCKEPEFTWASGDRFEIVDDDPGIMATLEGDACALLKLSLIVDDLVAGDFGEFGFKAEEIECVPGTTVCTNSATDELDELPGWYAHARLDSQGLLSKSAIQELALKLLFKGMRFILKQVENVLEGGLANIEIPIIGKRLDGGSGVCKHIKDPNGGPDLVGVLDHLETLMGNALDSVPDCDGAQTALENVIRFGDGDATSGNGIFNFLNDEGLLQDTNGNSATDEEDVIVLLDCSGTDPLKDLGDVRIQFLMGKGDDPGTADVSACNAGCDPTDSAACPGNTKEAGGIDMNLSIPGVPFGFDDARLIPSAGWRVMVDFGISRKKGPYIGAGKNGDTVHDDTTAEIRVGAEVALVGTGNCREDGATAAPALDAGFDMDGDVCAQATIAFLNAEIRSSTVKPDLVSIQTAVNIMGGDADGKIGFCELASGKAKLGLVACGNIGMSLRFRTEFEGTKGQLPNVLGHFNVKFPSFGVEWDTEKGTRAKFGSLNDLEIGFDQIHLDVGTFFSGFICPMFEPIQKATNPLMPIIDTVRTPIPLVSDISELVGGPKITLFSLMVLANGGKPITMIERLIELVEYIDSIQDTCQNETGSLLIGLGPALGGGGGGGGSVSAGGVSNQGGAFTVDKNKALNQKSTPDKAMEFIKIANKNRQKQLLERTYKAKGTASASKAPSSFSFPFLEDSSQVFGLLMGQDMTLVRFDAGEMVATAAFGVSYCCIPVGPVPVTVFIKGSATLKGRFAMGYDTFGLRQAFMREKIGAGTAVDLIKGVFIDDLDASGADVPELTLIGEVSAGAGVDIGFAAAGLEGGIRMTVDFNLDDRPDNDGKLRLDEVINRLSNPICLFEVHGKLEAFLAAWVRVGFEWFSKTWRFDILRITLLEFSAACSPPAPEPASLNSSTGVLTVNVGSSTRRKARNFNTDEEEEEVLLRQLTIANKTQAKNNGVTVSVSLMGFIKDYPGVKKVIVHGGSKNDVISLREGTVRMARSSCTSPGLILKKCSVNGKVCANNSECPSDEMCNESTSAEVECIIPFTVQAVCSGGGGDDRINGGGGDDTLSGDAGNDKISGGDGNDTINGGPGNDVLAGDAGTDTIHGNGEDDSISGGPGGDFLYGDAGSDDINGGPGTNELFGLCTINNDDCDCDSDCGQSGGTCFLSERGGQSADGNDWIEGGAGNDILQGFFGNDTIYGDDDPGANGNTTGDCEFFCSEAADPAGCGATTDGFDKIDGGPGDDILFGGAGNDTIGGEEGNDTICGNGGHDMLEGDALDACEAASGDDDIFGGAGHDQLFGRFGHDLLFGDEGNDALYGGEGGDDLVGGGGRDVLFGGLGQDILLGDGEMDFVSTHSSNSFNHNGHSSSAHDNIASLLGSITTGKVDNDDSGPSCASDATCGQAVTNCDVGLNFFVDPKGASCSDSNPCTTPGEFCVLVLGDSGTIQNKCTTELGPMLIGVPNDDNEQPAGNSDCLIGGDSDDLLFGEGGNDVMFGDGTEGECIVVAGSHEDYMEGNGGDDQMRGGAGDDTMKGNPGADKMFGDVGDDTMFGCDLDSKCVGLPVGSDKDTMRGGQGNDHMEGNQDGDTMFGDSGDDDMIGGSSNATYHDGDDTMHGNTDEDVMIGDNGTIDATTRAVELFNLDTCDADLGGNDTMNGNTDDDDMYGGCEMDTMHGDQGDDYMEGNPGVDTMNGGPGQDDMIGGTSQGGGGVPDDGDSMNGDAGQDVMIGDNGSIERPGGTSPVDFTINRNVVLFDLSCSNDALAGGDTMNGNANNDDMYGGCEDDTMHGNDGDDYMEGNGDDNDMEGDGDGDVGDLMFGDLGQDDMIGGTSQDGGGHPDGGDTMWGGDGSETEGEVSGSPNGIHDVMVGDNGSITRPEETVNATVQWIRDNFADDTQGVIQRVVMLFDFAEVGKPVPNSYSGADKISGELGRDIIYGGGSDDILHGDDGHDYIEGNDGSDEVFGDQGQDDIIGGTGRTTANIGAPTVAQDATAVDGRLDGDDTLYGGDGVADIALDFDVIIGDNGTIDRSLTASRRWAVNTFNDDAFRRGPRLLDIGTVSAAAGAGTSGSDTIRGEGNEDLLFGQGSNDFMFGGTGEDYMEGNDGDDEMEGNEGNDDMVGGTGRINLIGVFALDDEFLTDDEADILSKSVAGRLDGADTMLGNAGFDVMAGDNALIVRRLIGGQWESNSFNAGIQHRPRALLDIDGAPAAAGGDTMFGGHAPEEVIPVVACTTMDDCGALECCFKGTCAFEGVAALPDHDDEMYGQGADDCMFGNDGDDVMEGNAASDRMFGGAHEDDMIGGTARASVGDGGDDMYGNGADDVMIGDNGSIVRQLVDNPGQPDDGTWDRDLNTLAVIRNVFLFDVETVGSSISDAFSDADLMYGNDGNDHMFGQGDADEMHGGAAFDYMEGNHAGDLMFGDDGEDDMIGGGSANDGVILETSIGNGLLDGEDEMHGNDEGDVMAGDNARIVRAVDVSGIWLVDPNVEDVFRLVHLFDVERVVGAIVNPDTSGSDLMFGDAGRDLMFGQGNTRTDDDADGRFNEDPADGRDNDRDGREGSASLVYDCADGTDNDGDGLDDEADPDCAASIDEDGGGDEMHGGGGVDYMEGNHGSDWMFGDDDEDDMIGGSSAGNGLIGGGVAPTDLLDGDDTMSGNNEDDVMLGDNGMIVRPIDEVTGIWIRHSGVKFDLAVRVATMDESPEAFGAFGNDFMQGNAGNDDMYGQLGDDVMEGNDGEDAMVGDLGQITNRVEDGSRQRDIMIPAPFLEDTIFELDSFTRIVELFSFLTEEGAGGNDVILGGDGRDSLHGGPGNDLMNGDGDSVDGTDPVLATDDEDHVFGGDGDDVIWGGRSHDHLWGGHGDDHLDVRPRTASTVTAPDTPEWFTYGEPDHFQGLDIIYGGWGQDAMQANEAEAGPPLADRLIDWAGGYNVFYVCPGAYGEGTITRIASPDLREFLRDLAEADGALDPRTNGTSGFRELGYVFPQDMRDNAKPPHPDHPGHFVCDDGTVLFKRNDVTGRAREPGKRGGRSLRSSGDAGEE